MPNEDSTASGLPSLVRELAKTLDPATLCDAVFDRLIIDAFADRVDDEEFLASARPSVHDNIVAIFDVLLGTSTVADSTAPAAYTFAETMARLGQPWVRLERGYRIGHWLVWEEWFHHAEKYAAEHDIDLSELVFGPTRMFVSFFDHIVGQVRDRYGVVRREMDRTSAYQRSGLVRRILDGSVDHVTDLTARTLEYDLTLRHRAVILRVDETVDLVEVAENLLCRVSGIDARLTFRANVATGTIWLGRRIISQDRSTTRIQRELDGLSSVERDEDTIAEELRRVLEEAGMAGAVGDEGDGLVGFRRSYEQAERALHLGVVTEISAPAVAWYADVRLETLLLANEAVAREFVHAELGELAFGDERAARLRETLSAWLQAGGSHVGAASILEVHEHTVRNRLRQVEEALGPVLRDRRTELSTALRLRRVLTPSVS